MKELSKNVPGSVSGKVVPMDRFVSGRSLSPIRQAEAYWTALLDGTGVPKRSDIDPRGLNNILQFTFILERVAPGVARFRLAGSHLTELAGMEVRGMPVSAYFTPCARDELANALVQVFDAPAIAEFKLAAPTRLGMAKVEARMILMPLKSDLGDVSRVLGVLVADTFRAKTPVRFDIESCRVKPVSQLAARPVSCTESVAGLTADQGAFKSRTFQLRLVSSNDN